MIMNTLEQCFCFEIHIFQKLDFNNLLQNYVSGVKNELVPFSVNVLDVDQLVVHDVQQVMYATYMSVSAVSKLR